MNQTLDTDLAILGSGFAGSLLALIGRRLGFSVILIEKSKHPRFAIGESSTPLANILLEELAERYGLREIRSLTKWGPWQKHHPDIACGLKRGFTFFHHRFSGAAGAGPAGVGASPLLVGANPSDAMADTHWFREDFDAYFARLAAEAGCELFEETSVTRVRTHLDYVELTAARKNGGSIGVRAQFVFDASGPWGCLFSLLGLKEAPPRFMPPTSALFNHFRGAAHWDELFEPIGGAPYPADDAAVHHIFPGGWVWVLRFNNGVTSAGVAAEADLAEHLGLSEGAPGWDRLLKQLPGVGCQFARAEALSQWRHAPRLYFRCSETVGQRWALLPSATGFVDPLLSTGFPLVLLGVQRLAALLERGLSNPGLPNLLEDYHSHTQTDITSAERMIGALYANFHDPELFGVLALLYFAAASYTETARRLAKPGLAGGQFLLGEVGRFAAPAMRCLERARSKLDGPARAELIRDVFAAIEPFDVAGLGPAPLRPFYPVRADDLRGAAHKLQAQPEAIEVLIRKAFGCVSP